MWFFRNQTGQELPKTRRDKRLEKNSQKEARCEGKQR